ncbi:MAG: hypothetical protein ABI024_08950 [Vicinamibacterales bacterium]
MIAHPSQVYSSGMAEGLVGWPVDAIVIALVVVLNGLLGYLLWFSELRKLVGLAFWVDRPRP